MSARLTSSTMRLGVWMTTSTECGILKGLGSTNVRVPAAWWSGCSPPSGARYAGLEAAVPTPNLARRRQEGETTSLAWGHARPQRRKPDTSARGPGNLGKERAEDPLNGLSGKDERFDDRSGAAGRRYFEGLPRRVTLSRASLPSGELSLGHGLVNAPEGFNAGLSQAAVSVAPSKEAK